MREIIIAQDRMLRQFRVFHQCDTGLNERQLLIITNAQFVYQAGRTGITVGSNGINAVAHEGITPAFFEKQGQVFFLGDLIQKNHTAPILAFFINAKALHRNRSGCVCD